MSNDPFDILKQIKILSSDGAGGKFNATLADIYILFMAIAAIGLAASIIKSGLKYAFSNSPNARHEAMHELLWKVAIGMVIFGFTYFVNIIYGLSKAFS